jgi:CheY-like chemotaxis protein
MKPGAELAGRRVLVVEDEALVMMMIEDVLLDAGCEVVVAGNVARALAAIGAERFDAAILDVNLDGSPSYDVADALAARGTPFLFSTGYGADGMRPAYRHCRVLTKPFAEDDLVRSLSAIVAARERGADAAP